MCKGIVASFSRSWKKQHDLVVAQEQKKLPQHKLKADIDTQWGSSYKMVERLIEQMEAIRIVLQVTENPHTSYLHGKIVMSLILSQVL